MSDSRCECVRLDGWFPRNIADGKQRRCSVRQNLRIAVGCFVRAKRCEHFRPTTFRSYAPQPMSTLRERYETIRPPTRTKWLDGGFKLADRHRLTAGDR